MVRRTVSPRLQPAVPVVEASRPSQPQRVSPQRWCSFRSRDALRVGRRQARREAEERGERSETT